jgi:hypothetical protein
LADIERLCKTLSRTAIAASKGVGHWLLTTLREKLVKIGAKVTRHSKYVTFQLAEVAVTRIFFAAILDRIERLAIPPPMVARTRAQHDVAGRRTWQLRESTHDLCVSNPTDGAVSRLTWPIRSSTLEVSVLGRHCRRRSRQVRKPGNGYDRQNTGKERTPQ